MLNTGFDCREILHLVMCRSVRAPSCINKFEGEGHNYTTHQTTFVIYDFQESRVFQHSDTDVFSGPNTGKGFGTATSMPKGGFRPELTELGN